jgi:hypothetical protein
MPSDNYVTNECLLAAFETACNDNGPDADLTIVLRKLVLARMSPAPDLPQPVGTDWEPHVNRAPEKREPVIPNVTLGKEQPT